eukprot:scaffold12036_cov80-Isochrysis_galbana.AAC.3
MKNNVAARSIIWAEGRRRRCLEVAFEREFSSRPKIAGFVSTVKACSICSFDAPTRVQPGSPAGAGSGGESVPAARSVAGGSRRHRPAVAAALAAGGHRDGAARRADGGRAAVEGGGVAAVAAAAACSGPAAAAHRRWPARRGARALAAPACPPRFASPDAGGGGADRWVGRIGPQGVGRLRLLAAVPPGPVPAVGRAVRHPPARGCRHARPARRRSAHGDDWSAARYCRGYRRHATTNHGAVRPRGARCGALFMSLSPPTGAMSIPLIPPITTHPVVLAPPSPPTAPCPTTHTPPAPTSPAGLRARGRGDETLPARARPRDLIGAPAGLDRSKLHPGSQQAPVPARGVQRLPDRGPSGGGQSLPSRTCRGGGASLPDWDWRGVMLGQRLDFS